jgi:carbonic anhydrase
MVTPINRLIAGFRGFRSFYYEQHPERISELAKGQKPDILLIACSDSRVDPAIVTHSEPGELFVIRNIGNLVPPFGGGSQYPGTRAAVEYAVCDLGVGDIVVLGHSGCGGIQALMNAVTAAPESQSFIRSWVSIAAHAGQHVLAEVCGEHAADAAAVEQAAIKVSLDNLMTFPWIERKVKAKELVLHGWWFDIVRGQLLAYEPDLDTFQVIA